MDGLWFGVWLSHPSLHCATLTVRRLLACTIVIFRKAGSIIAFSVVSSVAFALVPLLALMLFIAPLHHHPNWRRTLLTLVFTGIFVGIVVLFFYILHATEAFELPNSSGEPIFGRKSGFVDD